jgi:amidase
MVTNMKLSQDQFYTADGGQDIRDAVAAGGEPLIPHVDRLINSGKDAISVYEYWQLNKQKVDLQQRYLDKWNSTFSPATGLPVDILVMPPMPHVAVPHGGCRWVGYTKVWNFLDYTALVIPAGKVSSEDLQAKWDCEGRVQGSADEWNAKLWERSRDRMAELELPAGIQIVGRKCEEEKVLAAARVIDGLINGN